MAVNEMKIELHRHQTLFEELWFVTQAVAKEQTRFAIRYIKIEADYIVATDGHRLHVFYGSHGFSCGCYEIIKNTRTAIVLLQTETTKKFPDFQCIIPHHTNSFEQITHLRLTETVIGCLARHDIGICMDYIKPFHNIDRNWQIFYGVPEQPVRFISYTNRGRLEAVIMPVNLGYHDIKFTCKSERRHYAKVS